MDASPMLAPSSAPDAIIDTGTTHVSITMMVTSMESNINHASFKQCFLPLKERNLTLISNVKNAQNKFSATIKTGSACKRVSAELRSVSIAIQMAFTAIINNVKFSNPVFVETV